MSDEAPDEVVETGLQMLAEVLRKLRKQTLLVSSEYAGDEFHFRLRIPDSELQGISDQIMPIATYISYQQVKMRKEDGVWGVYVTVYDYITVGRSLARNSILRTSRGEWFGPFAFFIAYFVKNG